MNHVDLKEMKREIRRRNWAEYQRLRKALPRLERASGTESTRAAMKKRLAELCRQLPTSANKRRRAS